MFNLDQQKDLSRLRSVIAAVAIIFLLVVGYLFYQLANQLVYESFYNVRVSADVYKVRVSETLDYFSESMDKLPSSSFGRQASDPFTKEGYIFLTKQDTKTIALI